MGLKMKSIRKFLFIGLTALLLTNLTVDTTNQEGTKKGQGELIINEGLHGGSYQVLLDMLH